MLETDINKLKTFKILLAEDESDISDLIGGLFTDLGVDFEIVSDGMDGLKLIKEYNASDKPFSLIITDIHMPTMDGLTMLESLKKENIKIPAIIITALTDEEYTNKAKELDVKYYLNKPFDFQVLLETISKL